ncbi:MAG: hypothetical protein AB2657_07390, partial [Candidatus Thiodiazotropha endolucinida]
SFTMLDEPPSADPHARWCGEGGLETRPYPIHQIIKTSRINSQFHIKFGCIGLKNLFPDSIILSLSVNGGYLAHPFVFSTIMTYLESFFATCTGNKYV